MKELVMQIMVQVLEVLAVATKWIKQRPASELVVINIIWWSTESQSEKFVKRLVGRTDIEDAMKKLDKLTQEEALMASAGSLELLRVVDNKMDTVIDGAKVSACSSS
jgi:hypothetical protein